MAGTGDDGTDPYGAGAVERDGAPPEPRGPPRTATGLPVSATHHVITVDDPSPEPQEPVPDLGTRPLFPPHPALNRTLAAVLALVILQGVGLGDPDLAEALGNLAFRKTLAVVGVPLALVLGVTGYTGWRRRHAFQQEALDTWVAVCVAGIAALGAAQALWSPASHHGVLAVWWAALVLPLQRWREPRIDRAWLLEETRWYWLRGLLLPVVGVGLLGPGLTGWGLLTVSWTAAERMDRIEALLSDKGQDGCRVLEDDGAADALTRVPVLLFGPRDGSLGLALARCVSRTVRLDDPVSLRLRQTAGDDLKRPLDGSRHNQDVMAASAAVEERLRRRLSRVVASLDPQGRARYGQELLALAEASGVCDNPFLAIEAALLTEADPDQVLGDCGERFTAMSDEAFIRAGLAWLDPVGTPGVFTLDLDAAGALRTHGLEPLAAVFRPATHASAAGSASTWDAVLVRPRGDTLQRALVVRLLPSAQITTKHRLSRRLSGNEVYVISYGRLDAPVDALRDEWNLLSAAPVTRKSCLALNSSRSNRWRLVPEGAGDAVLFAQLDWQGEAQDGVAVQVIRLVHAAQDPC